MTRSKCKRHWIKDSFRLAVLGLLMLLGLGMQQAAAQATATGTVTGELRRWHRVTVTFDGPMTGEDATPNPFLDYRLNVTFTNGSSTYVVPGFFAADGDAANTSATSGNKWRVHFTPDEVGTWTYSASFRTGANVAISLDPNAGSPTAFDGATGTFAVAETDKSGVDFRGHGMLRYVGEHYLQFAGSGEYYLKGGADSPENFLGYDEFDGTYDTGGIINNFLHRYEPHAGDWNPGDPTWQGDKGRNIIGALNYLSSQGGNSVYLITYNIDGGDGRDTWPWTSHTVRDRYDVSKLDQWEIVFSHMDAVGIQIHLLTQETENDRDLGGLSVQRQLYYRELVARFSHHLALIWNIGEENRNSVQERRDFAAYIRALDPYDHPITVHTQFNAGPNFYNGLYGDPSYEATSLQGSGSNYNSWAIEIRQRSANAGRPWAIYGDEQGPAVDDNLNNLDTLRENALWGNLMGGGSGVEWYFGYQGDFGDVQSEDWRVVEPLWQTTDIALDFFNEYLPYWEMAPDNSLARNRAAYVLAKVGEIYAIYLPQGTGSANVQLNLGTVGGSYTVEWFNPRTGGALAAGSTPFLNGTGWQSIGTPPDGNNEDWVALVRTTGDPVTLTPTVPVTPSPTPEPGETGVTGFTLIDADTNQPIPAFDPLVDGAVVSLADLTTTNLSIRANTNPAQVGSVRFGLDSSPVYRTENVIPYALEGDSSGDYTEWNYTLGQHTVTATAYDGNNASGTELLSQTITFTIVRGDEPTPDTPTASPTDVPTLTPTNIPVPPTAEPTTTPPTEEPNGPTVTSFTLMDADSDQPIPAFDPIPDGALIDLAALPSTHLSVRANTDPVQVGSVRFDLNGTVNYATENIVPYALNGDSMGDFNGWPYTPGTQTLTATAYSSARAEGTAGQSLTITFTLLEAAPPPTDTPTDTPTVAPTNTPTDTPTTMPSLTPTDTPTITPVPPTATITPTNTPTPIPPEAEPTSAPQPVGPEIASLTLINADTNEPIPGFDPLPDGAVIDLAALPTDNLNMRANPVPGAVGSVRFGLNSDADYRVENVAPYALAGDSPTGQYRRWTPEPGAYTVTATAYSETRARGTSGAPYVMNFTVVETPPLVASFTLINADTDEPIPGFDPIPNGAVIDLATLPTANLSIRANTTPPQVGSVRFGLNGDDTDRTENVVPYSLTGDSPTGDYRDWNLEAGTHTVTATAYSESRTRGTAGQPLTLTFTLIDGAPVEQVAASSQPQSEPDDAVVVPDVVVVPDYDADTADPSTDEVVTEPPLEPTAEPTSTPAPVLLGLPAFDSLEDGVDNWQAAGWQLATDTTGDNGVYWLATASGNVDVLLWDVHLDLTTAATPQLMFLTGWQGTGLTGVVQARTSDQPDWQVVTTLEPTTDSEAWATQLVDLTAYRGQVIQLRFAALSAEASDSQWWIDAITVADFVPATVEPTDELVTEVAPTDAPPAATDVIAPEVTADAPTQAAAPTEAVTAEPEPVQPEATEPLLEPTTEPTDAATDIEDTEAAETETPTAPSGDEADTTTTG